MNFRIINLRRASVLVFFCVGSIFSVVPTAQASYITSVSSQWTDISGGIYYNTGNIGIGTTTPVSKLFVDGGAINVGDGAGSYSGFQFSGGALTQTNNNAVKLLGALQVTSTAGGNSYISGTGNVGIGTTTPGYKLDINTPSGVTGYLQITGNGVAASNGFFRISNYTSSAGIMSPVFWSKSSNTYPGVSFIGDTTTDSGSTAIVEFIARQNNNTVATRPLFSFQNYTNTGTVMQILANGNVGFGTTAPGKQLEVGGTGQAKFAGYAYGLTPVVTQTDALATVEYVNAKAGGAGGVGTGTSGQTLRHNGTGWIGDSLLYNNGTNVGVGITNPYEKLTVNGRASFANNVITESILWPNVYDATSGRSVRNVILNTDDLLAYAVERGYTVTASRAPDSGASINYMFRPEKGSYPIWTGVAATPVVITISNLPNLSVDRMIIVPGGRNAMPINYKVETYDIYNAAWVTRKDVTGETGSYIKYINLSQQEGVQQIRITVTASGDSDQADKLSISSIVVTSRYQAGRFTGYALSAGGDTAYGAMTFTQNSLFPGSGIWNTSGNVGIGTTAPGNKLEVSGGDIQTSGFGHFKGWATGGATGLGLDAGISSSEGWLMAYNRTTSAYSPLNITAIGGAPNIYLATSRNVGIGSTTPSKLLSVAGQAKFVDYAYGITPIATQTDALATVEYVNAKSGGAGGVGTGTSGQTLRHNGTGWIGDSLLYNNGTNVGVGTTNPREKIDVAGTLRTGVDGELTMYSVSGGSCPGCGTETVALQTTIDNRTIADGLPYDSATRHSLALQPTWGYVGVGTTTPAYKLDVMGVIRAKSTTGTNYSLMQTTNSGGDFYWGINDSVGTGMLTTGGAAYDRVINTNSTYPLKFATNNAVAMTILNGGNVGIGITSPADKLVVSGASGLRIQNSTYDANLVFGANDSWKSGIRVWDNGDAEMRIWHANSLGQIVLATGYNGDEATAMPTDGLFIDQNKVGIGYASPASATGKLVVNGNVGISTTTPGKLLHVAGQAKFDSYAYGLTPVSTDTLALATVEYVNAKSGGAGGVGAGTSGQTLRHNGTGWVGDSTLFNNGTNVGIGLTNPLTKLHVETATGGAQITLKSADTATGGASMRFIRSTTGSAREWWMGTGVQSASDPGFSIYDSTGVATRMYFKTDGNLGIGTTNPDMKFHVQGSAYIKDVMRAGNFRHVLSTGFTSTAVNGYLLTTTIPYEGLTNRGMHTIRIQGFAYGYNEPIDFVVNFYLYGSGFSTYAWTNYGAYNPGTVKLSYEGNVLKLWWSNVLYYPSFEVFTTSWIGAVDTNSYFEGWTITDAAAPTTNVVDVPYANAEPRGLTMGGNLSLNGNWLSGDGGGEGVFVLANGNVGVGTSVPGKLFNVAGQAKFDSYAYGLTPVQTDTLALATVEYVNSKSGGAGGVGAGTSGQTLRHDGTGWIANSLLYNNGTNVGVGTTTPGAKLHVYGGGATSFMVSPDTTTGGIYLGAMSSYNFFSLNGDNTISNYNFLSRSTDKNLYINRPSSNLIQFREGNTAQMTLAAGGNLGIGITNPNSRLHSYNSTADGTAPGRTSIIDVLTLETANTAAAPYRGFGQGIEFRGRTYQNATTRTLGRIATVLTDDSGTNTGTDLVFQNVADSATVTAPVERMRINYNGNVGIGVTNPGAPLDVRKSGAAGYAQITADNYGPLFTGNGNLQFHTNNAAYVIDFQSAAGGYLMRILDSGYVGIGSTTPSKLLSVAGQAKFVDYAYGITPTSVQTDALATVEYVNGATISGVWKRTAPYIYPNTLTDNVGIGVTNPGAKLDVRGEIWSSGSGGNSRFVIGEGYSSAQYGALGWNAANNYLWLDANGNSQNIILQSGTEGSGNVGIGTTNPGSYKLNVAGDQYISGYLSSPKIMSGVVYAKSATLTRALNEPAGWVKIWDSGGGSVYTTNFRITDSYDNRTNNLEFRVTTSGYGQPHSIVMLPTTNYNAGTIEEIRTQNVSNTQLEVWVKISAVGALYAGSITVHASDTGLVSPLTFTTTQPTWGTKSVAVYPQQDMGNLPMQLSSPIRSFGAGSNYFAGNVGVGVTNPVKKLQVHGDIALSNGGKIGQGNGWGTDGNSYNATLELYNGSTGYTTLQSATAYGLLLNPSGGNVGVGTTTPVKQFSVAGQAKFVDYAYGITPISTQTDALATVEYVNASLTNGTGVWKRTAPYVYPSTLTDNVGIGVTAPGNRLDVYNDSATYNPTSYNVAGMTLRTAAAAGDFSGIRFTAAGARESFFGVVEGAASNKSNFVFQGYDGTSLTYKEFMRINDTGNVGIGVTNPEYKLDLGVLSAEFSTDRMRFNDYNGPAGGTSGYGGTPGGGTAQGTGIIWKPNYVSYTKRSAGILQIAEGNYFRAGLAFYTNNVTDATTDWSEAMRISSAGNVGIGTTTPGAKLTVVSASPVAPYSGASILSGASGDYTSLTIGRTAPELYFGIAATTNHWMTGTAAGDSTIIHTGKLHFGSTVGGTVQNTIDTAGNVGIGTTGPSQKLTIKGGTTGAEEILRVYNGNATYPLAGAALGVAGHEGEVSIYDSAGAKKIYLSSYYNSYINPRAGNVGIGSTTPNFKLSVSGTAKLEGLAYGVTPGVGQTDALATVEYVNASLTNGTGPWQRTAPYIYPSALADNVGIGVTNPTAKLQVNGKVAMGDGNYYGRIYSWNPGSYYSDAPTAIISNVSSSTATQDAYPQLIIHNQEGTVGNFAGIGFSAKESNSGGNQVIGAAIMTKFVNKVSGGWNSGDLYFITKNLSTRNDAMVIRYDGTVGIGTTNPLHKLQVSAGNSSLPNTSAFSVVKNEEGYGLFVGIEGSGNSWLQSATRDNTTKYNLTLQPNGGNVGVGIVPISYKLDVSGTFRAAAGTAVAGLFNATADNQITLQSADAWTGIGFDDVGAVNDFIWYQGTYGTFAIGGGGSNVSGKKLHVDGGMSIGASSDASATLANGLYVEGGAQFNQVAYGITPALTNTLALATVEYVNGKTGGSGGVGIGTIGQTLRHNGTGWIANSTLFNDGTNVGIGLTNPAQKLEVSGYIKSKTGIVDRNMMDTTVWTLGTGTIGGFVANGAVTENERIWDVDSLGRPSMIWRSVNDVASDADGGWDYVNIPINPNKAYRSVIWVKKDNTGSGSFYLGCSGSNTLNLNGTANTNPYFFSASSSNLISGRWYLVVGYIHANNDSSTTSYSAVYDGVTGKKVLTGTDFKNSTGTTQVHRTYNYYDTNTGSVQSFWGPRFEEIDGNEPTVESLLGIDQGATRDGIAYFGGNVGIGVTNPAYPLQISSATADTSLLIHNNTVSTNNTASLRFLVSTTNAVSNEGGRIVFTRTDSPAAADGHLSIWTRGSGTPSERMRIASNGYVGIGSTTPTFPLSVSGETKFAQLAYGVTPTSGNSYALATVEYVNGSVSGGSFLPLAGGTMSGPIDMGQQDISNLNKLTVNTIDPLYKIKGINYSTYAASISGGVKEESIGRIKIANKIAASEYEAVIDFSQVKEGSDLWVWRQVVDFNKDNVEVLLTPYGRLAQVYYIIEDNKLVIRANRAVEVSYRLIGKRFDWRKWPTRALDQSEQGMEIK